MHSLIRHPDMPRAAFRVLWDTVPEGREIFADESSEQSSGIDQINMVIGR